MADNLIGPWPTGGGTGPALSGKSRSFSVGEACDVLGLSRRTLYRRIDDGTLVAFKSGGRTYITHASARSLWEQSRFDPNGANDG